MQIRAAVVTEQGKPLTIETLELAPPGDGEVLVEIKAAGVCHSDLHAISGDWPMKVPLVPGHEGAGIVRVVGDHVTRVSEGDHVVLCWAPACGECAPCREGTPLLCDRLEKTTFRNKLPWGGSRLSRVKAEAQGETPGEGQGTGAEQEQEQEKKCRRFSALPASQRTRSSRRRRSWSCRRTYRSRRSLQWAVPW